jgi:hypothetical protein
MKKINFLLIFFFFLVSCGGAKEAGKILRNEKINNTDEFLVKKREPLVLPPDYKELPAPGDLNNNNKEEEEKIKNILKMPEKKKNIRNKNSSIEDSIINSIRK